MDYRQGLKDTKLEFMIIRNFKVRMRDWREMFAAFLWTP